MTVILEIRTVSEPNCRDSRWAKIRRTNEHRGIARGLCAVPFYRYRLALRGTSIEGVDVKLTRIGPRRLDDDNLRGALKAVRDGVADALGLKDDSDPRVAWKYEQRSQSRGYSVAVDLEPRWAPP